MMKIMYEVGTTLIGGAENFLIRLVNELRKILPDYIFEAGVLLDKGLLHDRYKRAFHNVIYFSDAAVGFPVYVEKKKFDIVHAIDSFDLVASWAEKLGDKINFIHNVFPDLSESEYSPNAFWLDNGSNYSVFITEIEKNKKFLKKPGKEPRIVEVIKNGIETDLWSIGSKKIEERGYDACWVGRAEVAKGLDIMIDIVESNPKLKFCIVVNQQKRKFHEKLVELERSNRITYKISIAYDELLAVYQNSKIYFHTSVSEGGPATPLEAMLCGCIPIVGGVGGLIDYVDNDYGRIISYADKSKEKQFKFSEAARSVLDINYEQLNDMSRRAREYVLKNHDIKECAKRYAEIYQQIERIRKDRGL